MACERWSAELDRFLDGELEPHESSELSAHLRSCAICGAETLERLQMKRAVRAAGLRYEPSAALRQKIARTSSKPPTRLGWGWKWAAATALVLLIASGVMYSRRGEQLHRAQVYSELADLHVATLASASPVDVLSSDRHTVKPWFQGKIPFAFNLPEVAGSEFSLIGGRVAYFEQAPGAHLIYQVRKHEISVFIFQERASEPAFPSGAGTELSFHVESWMQGGLRYVVVGDAGADDIHALSSLLQGAG